MDGVPTRSIGLWHGTAEAVTELELVPKEGDEQFGLLLDLTREINEGANPEEVFGLVAGALRTIFSIDRFAIVLRLVDGTLRLAESRGLSADYLDQVRAHIHHGAGARALQERKPLLILDAATSPEFEPLQEAAAREGFHTVFILPLFAGAEPLGYVIMYHDEVRAYTPTELALAQALAQQAAFAVQHNRFHAAAAQHRTDLERRFQQRVAEVMTIDEILLQISSSLDPRTTLQSIVDAAVTLTSATFSSLWLRNAHGSFQVMASHGVPLHRLQRIVLTGDDGLIGEICRTGRAAEVANPATGLHGVAEAREERAALEVGSVLGVPMLQGNEVIGVLYVARSDIGNFSSDTISIMSRLASFAQVALQNAQRFTNVEAERSRLQAYVDAIPEGVIVFDRHDRVVLVNETLRRDWEVRTPMVGLRTREVFQQPDLYTSQPLHFHFDAESTVQEVLTTGDPKQGVLEVEGLPRTFEVHFNALRGQGAEADGVVATVRDVTVPLELGRERSRSHLLSELLDVSALLNSNLSVAALMERVIEAGMMLIGAHSGTLGLLEGDCIVFPRFRTHERWIDFGVSVSQGEGAPGYAWQTGKPYISNDCANDPHVLTEYQQRMGFQKLVVVPMVDRNGTMVGIINVYDPIIERDFNQRDVEALQMLAHQAAIAIENARLSELKDEFLSIVSHELKTPITSIKGFAQVLRRRLPPESLERSSHYLDVINHQADRLTGLINDLLDLSRTQTGRFHFDVQTLDYSALLVEVVNEMRMVAATNKIVLTFSDSVDIKGNQERLRQVLVNLIDNAFQHGPRGGDVTITVEVHDDEVTTFICDEGNGIPADEAERIFRPYYQVRHQGRQQAKGLGLGLYISQQIVSEHGGRIWLDTNDHTSFCFTVPRA